MAELISGVISGFIRGSSIKRAPLRVKNVKGNRFTLEDIEDSDITFTVERLFDDIYAIVE